MLNTNRYTAPLKVILLLLLIALANHLQAQEDSTAADSAMKEQMEVWRKTFAFEKPGSSFEPMTDRDGYGNAQGAKVGYIAFPALYEKVLEDFTKPRPASVDSLLYRKAYTVNGIRGYLVKSYYKSPDKAYEDYISLQFIYPYNKITILMFGACPKSLDAALEEKMLRCFGTLREVKK